MSVALWALRLAAATPARVVGLRRLFGITARGFGVPVPPMAWRPGCVLAQYRDFTAVAACRALEGEADASMLRARLRMAAYAEGHRLRRLLRLRSTGEAMAAARLLYGAIGIDLQGDSRGRIEVRTCYFSRRYSPDVCRFVSALDEGIVAGLHGGGSLRFEERLTEGHARCLAWLSLASRGEADEAGDSSR